MVLFFCTSPYSVVTKTEITTPGS